MPLSKRSAIVTLGLIGMPAGVAALSGLAGPAQQMRRNFYADRAACERDYSPQQCRPDIGVGAAHFGGYYGPYYHANRNSAVARDDPGAGRFGYYTRTELVSVRGGFGRFGRGLHGVG